MNPLPKKTHNLQQQLILGQLPVEVIYRALGLELEPGLVVFKRGAQKHAKKRHPDEFDRCLPHVGTVVTNPLYVGDDFKNPGKIEFVSRVVSLRSGLLVAVNVEQDSEGSYNVASMYTLQHSTIEARREKKRLIVCK